MVSIVLLQACKNDEHEPEGQPICASDQFQITEGLKVNNSNLPDQHIDFTSTPYKVKLTAAFNEDVDWILTITGNTSGAIKTFTARSSRIDIDWYGNADADIFFEAAETVSITLTPSCESATSTSLIIDNKAIFDHFGYLLMDLDYLFPEYTYVSNVTGIDGYVKNVDTVVAMPSPHGGRCQTISAPRYHSGWYIGGCGNFVYDMSAFAGNISSDSIYLNFYLKGNSNTVAMVLLKETVAGVDYNFTKSIPITWTGWKFISLKFSNDLKIGVPSNVKNIDIQAGSSLYNYETEMYLDFVILTKGKPFNGPN